MFRTQLSYQNRKRIAICPQSIKNIRFALLAPKIISFIHFERRGSQTNKPTVYRSFIEDVILTIYAISWYCAWHGEVPIMDRRKSVLRWLLLSTWTSKCYQRPVRRRVKPLWGRKRWVRGFVVFSQDLLEAKKFRDDELASLLPFSSILSKGLRLFVSW